MSAIRLLGRRGIQVYAVDHLRSPLGFRSRYAVPRRVPDPGHNEPAFTSALQELADEIGRPVPVFPARDEDLNALARNHERLGNRFLNPFPSWDRLLDLQRKSFQVQRAAELDIPIPETATNADAVERYPVLVKPSQPTGFRARFGVQALRCETRAELERALTETAPFEPLVQELIPGPDGALFTLGVYIDQTGNPVGIFCGRKIRQSPRTVGTCRVGEALWVDEVVEHGLRLVHGIEFTGIAQVEFKYDHRDQEFKFIEINPRLWQWHENAAACGVDLPWIAYRDLNGDPSPPTTSRGCRRRWALTLHDNLVPALVRPPYTDPLFAPDDPRLAVVHLARVAKNTRRNRIRKPFP